MLLPDPVLKPQDVVVLLKLVSIKGQSWSYIKLAKSLKMSSQSVYAAVFRAEYARLFDTGQRRVLRPALREMLNGLRYFMPAKLGATARGIPTAWGAEPLLGHLNISPDAAPVWPHPSGHARGPQLVPLHKGVPEAAVEDANFYELLALADALRAGQPRDVELAKHELGIRLK